MENVIVKSTSHFKTGMLFFVVIVKSMFYCTSNVYISIARNVLHKDRYDSELLPKCCWEEIFQSINQLRLTNIRLSRLHQ